jgi:hypothetical protein
MPSSQALRDYNHRNEDSLSNFGQKLQGSSGWEIAEHAVSSDGPVHGLRWHHSARTLFQGGIIECSSRYLHRRGDSSDSSDSFHQRSIVLTSL